MYNKMFTSKGILKAFFKALRPFYVITRVKSRLLDCVCVSGEWGGCCMCVCTCVLESVCFRWGVWMCGVFVCACVCVCVCVFVLVCVCV